MIISRRTYNRWRGMYRQVLTERLRLRRKASRLEKELADLRRVLGEADAEVKGLDGRLKQSHELLKKARQDQGAEVAQLRSRLERAVGACARYRAEVADARRPRPAAPGGSTLMLSERARRSLAEQLASVQAANDSMCRELADRSGTLTVERPAGREPGVAS
ncbi:hypothetical protein [Streptomyces sp. XH2]|uniref:hypothetical protein n=1 Tax=Streptomyces sp. XH2 TaxID=3412483 RepID=UPI003C7E1F44